MAAKSTRKDPAKGALKLEVPKRYLELGAERPAAGRTTPLGPSRPSYMVETNLGGVIENVPGLDVGRILVDGLLDPRRSGVQMRPSVKVIGPTPELAFGEGPDWTPVPNTAGAPWRSICHLEMRFHSGRTATGTGWLVSADTLVTAGHNLKHPQLGEAKSVTIVPGRNGISVAPYGSLFAVAGGVHPDWSASIDRGEQDLSHDVAYLKIDDADVGRRLGWFGLLVLSDDELREFPLIIHSAGYPGQKPTGTQWVDAGRISDFDGQFIYYRLDTLGGNSGAPLFASFKDGQRQVVACHSHGTASGTSNAGVRITKPIFEVIEGWIDRAP